MPSYEPKEVIPLTNVVFTTDAGVAFPMGDAIIEISFGPPIDQEWDLSNDDHSASHCLIRTRSGGLPKLPKGTRGTLTGDEPEKVQFSLTIYDGEVDDYVGSKMILVARSLDGCTASHSFTVWP